MGVLHDRAQQVEVRALERAVLRHVGDDVTGAAGELEALEHGPQVAALLRPAARRERRAAHVEADRDGLAVLGDDVRRPLGVLESRGAEIDAFRARCEGRLEARVVADAAGELDVDALGRGLDDLLDDRAVVAAAESRVEVDEVDPLRTLVGPLVRGVDRVAVVRLGARLTLGEPHRLASGDVHRGQQRQGRDGGELAHGSLSVHIDGRGAGRSECRHAMIVRRHKHHIVLRTTSPAGQPRAVYSVRSQLPRSARPALPDFSGWNCVEVSGPFSTAATKRSPCSLHVTRGARIFGFVTSRLQSWAA